MCDEINHFSRERERERERERKKRERERERERREREREEREGRLPETSANVVTAPTAKTPTRTALLRRVIGRVTVTQAISIESSFFVDMYIHHLDHSNHTNYASLAL